MYEESSDDGGKFSALRNPQLRELRGRSLRRPGYREESTWSKMVRRNPVCQLLTSHEFWFLLICSGLLLFVVYICTTPAPYCPDKQGCNYNKTFLPWECKPCPPNALCDGERMVSDLVNMKNFDFGCRLARRDTNRLTLSVALTKTRTPSWSSSCKS